MKVLPINGTQPKFKARFPMSELKMLEKPELNPEYRLASEEEKKMLAPMLYTMLEFLDKLSGKKASIVCKKYGERGYSKLDKYKCGDLVALTIDNKIIQEYVSTPLHVLFQSVTEFVDGCGRRFQLPKSVFEKKELQNKDKTTEDIEKYALEG